MDTYNTGAGYGYGLGWGGVGMPSGGSAAGRERSANRAGNQRDFGPRNPDGTWMGGVVRGPSKPFPFSPGDKFGELTCIGWDRRPHGPEWKGKFAYQPRMRCECGWEGFIERSNLRGGRTTRCNTCAKKKATATRMARAGFEAVCPDAAHRNRLLDRISAVIVRCTNPKSVVYPDYGGRGITVYAPWIEQRVEFLRYLVELDGWDQPELQLDRIDNNRGYEPGNLRFVTRSQNMSNKRKIKARDVEALKQQLRSLKAENADLRHCLRRAEEQIHNSHK